jgi:hypothetical protein
MKKAWLIILSAAVIAAAAVYLIFFSNSYIYAANENMDMDGWKLLTKRSSVTDLPNGSYTEIGGFGCDVFESEKDGVRIVFSGLPDVSNEYVLTDIAATNPSFHFYGVRVGDPAEKAEAIFKENGFMKTRLDSGGEAIYFSKKKLTVLLNADAESVITEIRIFLKQTNIKNIIF